MGCALLLGVVGSLLRNAPTSMSIVWFPARLRALSTAATVVAARAGYALCSLLSARRALHLIRSS